MITTESREGLCHIAPMGVQLEDDIYLISPFKPSTTLNNLLSTGAAVINFTDDVLVIAGCLTGRRDWGLSPATKITGQVLDNTLGHAEVEVVRMEEDELRPRFYCKTVYEQNHAGFRGFNRAQGAVIEAAILASRLDMLPRQKVDNELGYLAIAVEKTAGEREKLAWEWLIDMINSYYDKNKGAVNR